MSKVKGFTLIEIAIVLVIIGLLAGGILKGQQMIANAKYARFKADVDAYRVAVFAFKDRYRYFPGDFPRASTAFAASFSGTIGNGNGDGLIPTGYCNVYAEESCIAMQHLMLAGLISGDPEENIGPTLTVQNAYGGGVLGIATYSPGSVGGNAMMHLIMGAIPGEFAQRYDDELDDGKANAGNIARGTYGGAAATDGTYDKALMYDLYIKL